MTIKNKQSILLSLFIFTFMVLGFWSQVKVQSDTQAEIQDNSQTEEATYEFTFSEEEQPILALGERLFQANCASCHGVSGEGHTDENQIAPAVNGSEHAWHHGDEQILGMIQNGGRFMPAVGAEWTQEEREAVWVYAKHWWTPEQREFQPGDLGEGMLSELTAVSESTP